MNACIKDAVVFSNTHSSQVAAIPQIITGYLHMLHQCSLLTDILVRSPVSVQLGQERAESHRLVGIRSELNVVHQLERL